jgi:hypothetical protein
MTPFENLKIPCRELPKPGERVRVICVKEMVYTGNSDDNGSDWRYDGHGYHAILFWEEIREKTK